MSDGIALLVSYVYVFAIIGLGEVIRRSRGYGSEFTRKVIHIGVGMWIFGTVALFESRTWALVPPLTFVLINYLSYRYGLFKAMETEEANPGTVYFPIAFAALIAVFWGSPGLLTASLMPMTWGDAMGAVLGRRWGRHRVGLRGRTLEGSAAMWAFGFVSAALALALVGQVPWGSALAAAAITSLAATLVEAFTPLGLDNLTVPAASALVLWGLLA